MTDKAVVTDVERAWNSISDDMNRWDMLSGEERETFTAFANAVLFPASVEQQEPVATPAPVPQKASLHPAGIAAAIDAVYATADGDARQIAEAVVAAYALATTEGSDNG
ncbi:MAG TPA: hypothetical protein VFY63_17170 [Pseudorhizobium sp.]|nr:hypothetical protein [Pseudorhizobium sp.]